MRSLRYFTATSRRQHYHSWSRQPRHIRHCAAGYASDSRNPFAFTTLPDARLSFRPSRAAAYRAQMSSFSPRIYAADAAADPRRRP